MEGGQDQEIRIAFNNRTVYEYSLNLSQIGSTLASENQDMPGGNFQNEDRDYSVSYDGSFKEIEDLENLLIPTKYGIRKLSQLAEVNDSSKDVKKRVTYFNVKDERLYKNSILISVIKSPDGNPVQIAEEIRAVRAEINGLLPESVTLDIAGDDSIEIKETVADTQMNIIIGMILTAAVLLLFLHDLRSTFIAGLSMPLSIIPSYIVLNAMGISMNQMSLMGLSATVGVLVMNSVVVLENIFRHKSRGQNKREAASRGTGEVMIAVFASTLTNICVFLPLGTMGGIVGLFLKDFALTVVIATIFSLIISFTLTPMLASLILPETPKKKMKISRAIESFFKFLELEYRILLEKILQSKGRSIILIASTLVLFAVSLLGFTKVPFEFTPISDTGKILVEVELPQDASLKQTSQKLFEIESEIKTFTEVDQMITTLGSISSLDTGTNLAKINIVLKSKEDRALHTQEISSLMSNTLADISNATIRVKVDSGANSSDSSSVSFYLLGDNTESLKQYTPQYMEAMTQIKGITSLDSSMKAGKPDIKIMPKRKVLADMGISSQQLALTIRSAIDGIVMTSLNNGTNEYDIRLTLADEDISSLEDIRSIPVVLSTGVYPVSFFAEIEIKNGVTKLMRINKKAAVEISASLIPGVSQSDVTRQIDAIDAEMKNDSVSIKWSGTSDLLNESIVNMGIAFIMAILLTYMLLAAVLGKFRQPLLILSTVPLSLIGVVAIFLITGFAMNLVSMLAIIMLVGMVVNNAILILEYTNQLRDSGMDVRSALLEACPTKLQPILMSNIATILGMLPMAMGIGASGAEMRQPMGLVSIGGLVTATFLSLFVIPALENVLEAKSNKRIKEVLV